MKKKMITNGLLASALALGATLLPNTSFAWNQAWSPAAVCTMASGFSTSPSLIPGMDGDVVNHGTTSQSMTCGVGQDEGGVKGGDDVLVFYKDANESFGNDLSCRVRSRTEDFSGAIRADATRYACSTAGGCLARPASPFASDGYLRLRAAHGLGVRIAVTCTLPPKSASGFASQVKTISLHQP